MQRLISIASGCFALVLILAAGCTGMKTPQNTTFSATGGNAAKDLPDLLTRGYNNATALVANIRFDVVSRSKTDPEFLKKFGQPDHGMITRRSCYVRQGKNEILLWPRDEKYDLGDRTQATQFQAFDGRYCLLYYPTQGLPDVTQNGRALRQCSEQGLFDTDSQASCLFKVWPSLGPDQVLASPDLVIEPDPVNVGGVQAYQATAVLKIKDTEHVVSYWFSAEKSGWPVRMELRTKEGVVRKVREVTEFLQLPDGQWFPKKVVHHDYITENGDRREIGVDTYEVERVEVNPHVSGSLFSTAPSSLPVGTVVQDQVVGVEYTIREPGTQEVAPARPWAIWR
jgi:hypothetical protein